MQTVSLAKNNGTRKSPTYLSDIEQYALYKYCIEHKCLTQQGTLTKYRVLPKIIADEINSAKILKDVISEHHVRKSIERVVEWQEILEKLPEPQATVYEDQLQADLHSKNIKIAKLEEEMRQLKEMAKGTAKEVETIKQAKIKCAELSRILHT